MNVIKLSLCMGVIMILAGCSKDPFSPHKPQPTCEVTQECVIEKPDKTHKKWCEKHHRHDHHDRDD